MGAAERRAVLQAWALVWSARLGLWLLPFARVQAWAARMPARSHAAAPGVERLAWAITATSRCVPRATCLTQALAGQALLARYGHAAQLRLGVAKAERGGLEAHAWLICGHQILIGGREVERYAPLPARKGPGA
ncbi:MAG: lasso peptide biosynthesis B2 protein [Anaerolineales bacterium]|nr:lasso peptide biosynthesis B2 protein [Anaerolineales bacterium]